MSLSKMTASHITLCLMHAEKIDPRHGERWKEAFDEKAKSLGYTIAATNTSRPSSEASQMEKPPKA